MEESDDLNGQSAEGRVNTPQVFLASRKKCRRNPLLGELVPTKSGGRLAKRVKGL